MFSNMKIKLLTDSTTAIPIEIMKKHDIEVLEIQIVHSDEMKKELSEMDSNEFTENFQDIEPVPTTSLASPADALEIMNKAIEEEYDIIFYPFITQKTSNQVNAVRVATKKVKTKIQVELYPSQLAGPSIAPILFHAIKLIEKGKDIKEIIDHSEEIKKYIFTAGFSKDFSTLFRTGKVKKNVRMTMITSLLKLRPLYEILLDQGVVSFGGGIGFGGSIKKIVNHILDNTDPEMAYDLIVNHSNDLDAATILVNSIKEHRNIKEINIWGLPPAIVCTVGKGAAMATLYPNFGNFSKKRD